MADFILDHLANLAAAGPLECPPAIGLVALAKGRADDRQLGRRLPAHLLSCPACARRWDLLQRDTHLDLAELDALTRIDRREFFCLRAGDHVARCAPCDERRTLLNGLVHASDERSVHWHHLGTAISAGPVERVHRGVSARLVHAAVLDAEGRPRLESDQLERVELEVAEAQMIETGTLQVALRVPRDCADVRLAISAAETAIMFPLATPVDGIARFSAQCHVATERRLLPVSSLAAWIRRAG